MKSKSEFLGSVPVGKLMTKLSVPAIIGMIFNAFYNLIDTIFVGRFVGTHAIGGLAIAFPIQMLMVGTGIMIGVGSASAVSRALGAKQIEKADNIAGNGFLSLFVISILFTLLGSLFLTPLLRIFGATDNILPYAFEYMQTILWGAIFLIGTITANNLVRAEGNAKIAMITMIIGTSINIILDPIFIKVLGFGIRGAAIATVIGRGVSFIYVISHFYLGKSSLSIKLHHFKPRLIYLKEIFTVGFPTFMRNISTSLLAIVLNNSLSFYGGDIAISVYGVINKLLLFSLMPMFGMAQGFQPIAGFNYGAKNYKRLLEAISVALKRFIIYGLFITVLVQVFPDFIMHLFTTDGALISRGIFAIRMIFIMIPFVGIQILSSVMFQSLGKARPAFVISISRQLLFLIPLVLILPRIYSLALTGIWLAFPIADVLSILLSGSLLVHQRKVIMSYQS